MTELLKTNPIALRHCLLYEFLQGNSAEKALLDFQRTVGKNVMNKKEIQVLFRRFAKGKFYKNSKKHDQVAVKDIFQSDKKALRTCILYLSLKSQEKTEENRYFFRFNSSFVMYEEFRKVIGNDVMEYREFDFWFYRFLNGEFDLDFEREKDKKNYELVDMPLDVMEKIVEYLDMFDRMSLTKTSRSLHAFTENQKLFHKTLELRLDRCRSSKIRFDEKHFRSYTNWEISMFDEVHSRRIEDWKEAILDFKKITKNPKLHLNTLLIHLSSFYSDPFEAEEHSLKPSTHQLNVKKLSFKGYCHNSRVNSHESFLSILLFLKPGYLTTIDVLTLKPNNDSVMEKIVESEQWKKAQYFSMGKMCTFAGSLRHLYHFKEFYVVRSELPVEDIREMKAILFKSPVFEKCSLNLYLRVDESSFEQEFGEAVQKMPTTYHHPIPNSNEYFEIKVSMNTFNGEKIEIARKIR